MRVVKAITDYYCTRGLGRAKLTAEEDTVE